MNILGVWWDKGPQVCLYFHANSHLKGYLFHQTEDSYASII